jgi:indole-3-glycerol phosphate synthase/phosphoribosylanthranilate isomerase
VGVFVDHSADEIAGIAAFVGLDVVQLHGDYDDDAVVATKARGYEVWRLYNAARGYDAKAADAILLDGRRGNESRRADWSLVEPLRRDGCRVVLAGGISTANIAAAIATGADVIDVNSSIEVAPGKKSLALLDELLAI